MILVENKELNLSVPQKLPNGEENPKWNELSSNERWVISQMQEIKKKKTYILKNPKKYTPMQLAFKPKVSFDVSGTKANIDTGAPEKWIFCDKKPKIVNGSKEYQTKHWGFFKQVELSTEKNCDLIFFLLDIVDVSQFGLQVENREAEAKKKISTRAVVVDVENWLYNKCTEGDITRFAWRWNIPDIEEKTITELRVEIFEKLQSIKGLQTFLDEVNSQSEVIKIGSYVIKAIKDKIIDFNRENRACFYYGTSDIICYVPPQRFTTDKEEYMIQYLANPVNESAKENFLNAISGEMETLAEVNDDYRSIKNVLKLRSYAKGRFGVDIGIKHTIEEGWAKVDALVNQKVPEVV